MLSRLLAVGLEVHGQLGALRGADAETGEDLGGDALVLYQQPEQEVPGADVGVVEQQSLTQRRLQDALRALAERNVHSRHGLARADGHRHRRPSLPDGREANPPRNLPIPCEPEHSGPTRPQHGAMASR